ncbi:hypothetical protein SAMN05421504_109133 [Amycolatopsis xylanica]|uniref:Uncharacterized protein n=1 Tax=Amycolatopsis xylanica TaxID=589385 RepID=A0A1H3Q5G4_9PSEU|nr:hypothetical protein [Amycolatopsis xylanica]SDZ08782.1 hypothetical protein SAMN05421504_109133 [Amycolatopsis xylanica]
MSVRGKIWRPIGVMAVAVAGIACVYATRIPPPSPLFEPPALSLAAPDSMPFDLLTHCGVDEAKIGTVYFEAEVPLIGTAQSAPPGWGNPLQPGRMTLLTPNRAVFRDDLGHEVFFRARPGATAPKLLCD